MGEFPADYIFRASGEVIDLLEAFEELSATRRATKQAESIDSDGSVDPARKTPCIQELATGLGGR
jgi:hypothetical protein